jgi:hypothetical protein
MKTRTLIAITVMLAASLGGCISQSALRSRAIDESATLEDITDSILVSNILRARDEAPLQFADIPLIHESFQITSGITPTILFGPVHPGSASNSVAPTISIQEAPTFDLNNLDTQEFIRGVMSPVKPRVVQYWLDRGLNDRIALLLFFSSVTISVKDASKAPLTISNDPRRALEKETRNDGFLAYLSLINSISGQFRIVEAPNLTPVGPPFPVEMDKHLKELSKVDTDKYELDPLELNPDAASRSKQPYTLVEDPVEGTAYPFYQLFSVADKKILICFNTARASKRSPADQKLCKQHVGEAARSELSAEPSAPCQSPAEYLTSSNCSATLKFSVRSAGDVIHFLGDLMWLQENPRLRAAGLYTPFTLRNCPPEARTDCESGGALFNLLLESPGTQGRFHVPYRGQSYTVPVASPDDHTLQVLAVTAQLINLNKSAKELSSTPTVQIVP